MTSSGPRLSHLRGTKHPGKDAGRAAQAAPSGRTLVGREADAAETPRGRCNLLPMWNSLPKGLPNRFMNAAPWLHPVRARRESRERAMGRH